MDGIGNNADADDDGDDVIDTEDAFPLDATETLDTDNDGRWIMPIRMMTAMVSLTPKMPSHSMLQKHIDSDNDGTGDNADADDDGDGVIDTEDAFPLDSTETLDSDGDGFGDNADSDDDGDGVEDTLDAFPLDSTESVDLDGDGLETMLTPMMMVMV